MKERLFDLLIGGLAGFLLAAGLSTLCYDKSVRRLQDYSHQVATSSARITTHARETADSLRRHADSLGRSRQLLISKNIIPDTTAAHDAHSAADRARAIGDLRAENVALRVENIALRRAVLNLWMAQRIDSLVIAAERARGDSLSEALNDVNLQLQSLAVRVEQLKPPPQLLRISWEVVKIGGALYGGYQLGKHDRCTAAACSSQRSDLMR